MSPKKSGAKGYETEELLRAYFLRAGFFVLRGIRLRHEGSELTDIDLWIYERSATLARRRTVIDIKDKGKPQAAERMFFIRGLAEIIGVEGAGVATTDSRPALRELARKHSVLWIDGADIARLKSSGELANSGRLSEEQFCALLAKVDATRSSRAFRDMIEQVKSTVGDRFGASSANVALEGAQFFAREAISAYPMSDAARAAARATYLAAAIAAAALDFASADSALRPLPERARNMTDVIRFGSDARGVSERLQWAEAAIREYAPNGAGLAQIVRDRFNAELKSVPAEALAEIVVKLTKNERLFSIARTLEWAAYDQAAVGFDDLDGEAKAFVGAVLDFVGVSRAHFARAYAASKQAPATSSTAVSNGVAEAESEAPSPTDSSAPASSIDEKEPGEDVVQRLF